MRTGSRGVALIGLLCYYHFHFLISSNPSVTVSTFLLRQRPYIPKSQNYPSTQATMDVGTADDHSPEAAISRWKFAVSRQYQHMLDKTTPHVLRRWIGCLVVAAVYVLRVYLVQGFYIVSYALGIYILNLLIGFLSPQVDPEISDGPTLPTRGSDEFRPFVRRLPEFKFCILANTPFLLGGPIHTYNEKTNITHDQIQICTVLIWETALRRKESSRRHKPDLGLKFSA
ncbi:hypothetical protein JHK84_030360 [Glycine max]|nr:hypothetical protein JHK84_030360 [Glycine max]